MQTDLPIFSSKLMSNFSKFLLQIMTQIIRNGYFPPTLWCISLFLSSAVAELAERPRKMLITFDKPDSWITSGAGEACFEPEVGVEWGVFGGVRG